MNQLCIKSLCDLFTCTDPRIVIVFLEGFDNSFKVGQAKKDLSNNSGINFYACYIDEVEGLEKIKNMQTHDNNEIYKKEVKILETCWLEEDEDQIVTFVGNEQQCNFSFGSNQPFVLSNGFNFD